MAAPCRRIAADPEAAYEYTAKSHLVAVVTDGSAVLGLGNIGALAGLPVMEGKAVLFKRFGGIDAVPICLATQDTEEIIAAVRAIAPTFGGINLEDISSPRCFEVEERLERELPIPVFHDDQHGTAIVVTAALLNALRLAGKAINEARIVLAGPGAAGTAIIKMLRHSGARNVTAVDEFGILYKGRPQGMVGHKTALCDITNPEGRHGNLADALEGADVFIGVSAPGIVTEEMIGSMADRPIVFAMANPTPEISYDAAVHAGAFVVGTGRSDRPNQINNLLAFPGIFRGALEAGARDINYAMKLSAARAIAGLIPEADLAPDNIVPNPFDPRVSDAVAAAVAEAARVTGALRIAGDAR